ncbi:RNA 2',3'-cyclic phosphodiesterase [Parasphingopyxis marina]|nr:RNA 2',3'-cyclic phosphodiesterase [Parasphingopyxis marina]
MQGISGARWHSDEQLHLTLRFIGDVDRHRAEDVAAALGHIAFPQFEIALRGIGHFGDLSRQRQLWAGVSPHRDLEKLHAKVDSALRQIGIEPDRRAFLPHITIARLNRNAGPIDAFAETHGGLSSDPFAVGHFALFESSLGREGARYETIARYPLA